MKITYPYFNRWTAIVIDGEPIGYMVDKDGTTEMHLGRDSPWWLRGVRNAGPYASALACKNAIHTAAPSLETQFLLGQNVVPFPTKGVDRA